MKEVDRLEVIREVEGRRLRQREAGERMGLSVRQVKRHLRCYRELGARGLISGHRGRKANNAIAPEVRAEILGVVRERYEDFSPTLAWEKLREVHGYGVSVETLRKWRRCASGWPKRGCGGRGSAGGCGCIRAVPGGRRWGSWCRSTARRTGGSRTGGRMYPDRVHRRRHQPAHGPAFRRSRDHRSLPEDPARVSGPVRPAGGPLFGQAQHLPGQSTGPPGRTDSVHTGAQDPGHPTHPRQHPPAKGRVERANETLQDRLVKELRLGGIDSIDQANAFLPDYMADHNRRFARPPRNPQDAHRRVLHDAASLDLILSLHSTRKLSRNLTPEIPKPRVPDPESGQGPPPALKPRHRVRSLRRSRHPVGPGQDPRLPRPRRRPGAGPSGRREEPPPHRRQRPCASA